MILSSDLLSQFVKITNDTDNTPKDTIVYGEVVVKDDKTYVRLDGAGENVLTPISYDTISSTSAQNGDRVMVTMKNHTAVITGNLTQPVTNAQLVSNQAVTVAELTSKNAVIEEKLTASEAEVAQLKANDVTITGELNAAKADIGTLKANSLDADEINALKANITEVEAVKGRIYTLETTSLTTDKADAKYATIEKLEADYATIDSLSATNLNVQNLNAEVMDINTLMFGSATGNVIQTSFANSVVSMIGNAQIKAAMIESISAGQITAGDIITNNVKVKSEDGSLVISDETMQISDGTRVRVQIGKDAANDYSINIWDQNGNLMFSEGGITDSAIKNAIIRDDMVSETADISASKLNINSLFEEINGSTNTIKSSKVYLDDKNQTLEVAFTGLSSTVTDQGELISSQGTAISTVQSQISSKIWQQDINSAENRMDTKYSELEQTLDGFKTTVSETYSTKEDLNNLTIGGRNLIPASTFVNDNIFKNATTATFQNNGAYVTSTKSYAYCGIILHENLVSGETYTFSCRAAASSNANYGWLSVGNIENVDSNTQYFVRSKIKDEVKIVKTFTATSNLLTMSIYPYANPTAPTEAVWMYAYDIKLEKGNKATDWTPAPEDMDTRMSSAETKIEQNAESIILSATKIELSDATKYSLRRKDVDLSDTSIYDTNTYYPVVGTVIPTDGYKIFQVNVHLDTNVVPWSSHSEGRFSCNLTARMKAYGWGRVGLDNMGWIDDFSCLWCADNVMPAYIQQMGNYSTPILYLRGGGLYRVYTDYECDWTIYADGYTKGNETASPIALPNQPTNYQYLVNNWADHAEIKVLSDRITSTVEEVGGLKSTIEQTAESWTLQFEDHKSDVGTQIDSIQVGGRNLIAINDFESFGVTLKINSTNDISVSNVSGDATSMTTITRQYDAGTYTINGTSSLKGKSFRILFSTNNVTLPDGKTLTHNTYYASRNRPYFVDITLPLTFTLNESGLIGIIWLGGSQTITGLKLEKGNKATDWTPAPEDVNDKIDSIQVGGRNLLKDTSTGYENSAYGLHGYHYGDPSKIVAGETYTLSFDGMLTDPVQTGFYINTYPEPYKRCVTIPAISTDGVYHHYTATFKMPDNGSFTQMGFYSNSPGNGKSAGIKNVKLEKGTKATDWTPAPEDVDASIASAATQATNYMRLDSTGLVVGNLTASVLGNNVLIDTDSVDIRSGSTVLASYRANEILLGMNDRYNTSINLCNGGATMTCSVDELYDQDCFHINAEYLMSMYASYCIYQDVAFGDGDKDGYANFRLESHVPSDSGLNVGGRANLTVTTDESVGSISSSAQLLMAEAEIELNYDAIDEYNDYHCQFKLYTTGEYDQRRSRIKASADDIEFSGSIYLNGQALDTGWINASIEPPFVVYSTDYSSQVMYRRVNKTVEIRGAVKPSDAISGGTDNYLIFTLPSGFRPSGQVCVVSQGSGTNSWLMSITSAGYVRFSRYNNGSGYVTAPVGAWLPFNATFLID